MKYGDQTLIEKQIELDAALMFKKRKEDSILGFTGYWDFLKPEFPAKVSYDGELYNSVSHVYTALQTEDETMRRRILKAPTVKDMLEVSASLQASQEFV